VTTATLEVVAGRGTYFPGPWHAWRREKAARMLNAQKEVSRVQADIVRLERFVERFRAKKDKAKQAQAKLTQIGRLEKERQNASAEVALLSRPPALARLRVPEAAAQRANGRRGRRPRRAHRRARAAPRRDVRHRAGRARRHSSGRTGPARTTLLETLLGRRAPTAGRVHLGHGVEAAYFSQQELELDTRGSVLQCVQTMTGLSRPDAQSLLGKFLFSAGTSTRRRSRCSRAASGDGSRLQ